ncbi:MAG: N-acetylmuramoyl-L-alanine amidase [Eubacteriales bacterium]|nr:N-acetylmuramoyl-L-alanine amidase [Eubacteriales bacterium]MDD4390800.1 N-acetylmuramoyl-L-alanine amidase [Eubacteriales bacterium]
MKKLILTFMAVFTIGVTSFAAPVHGATITDINIKAGLDFCNKHPITLAYNGLPVDFGPKTTPPIIITPEGQENGRTLIPARAIFEAAGALVTWNEESQSVTTSYYDKEIVLTIGEKTALVNGASKELDMPALIIDHDYDYYGSTMIPVRFMAENLGFGIDWEDNSRTVNVAKSGDVVQPDPIPDPIPGKTPDKDDEPDENVDVDKGTVNLDMADLPKASKETADKIIVIDAGHGGKDPGSIGNKGKRDQLYEKEINIKVALLLEQYLEEAGIETIYLTRTGDTSMGLQDRPIFANEKDADLFVSIHNNSSEYEAPNGTEVHYYEKVDGEGKTEEELYGISSKAVAKSVQKEMLKYVGAADRKIKSSPKLAVLNKTDMPAIIIEGAFMSNDNDLKLISSKDYPSKYAFACARGIINSLNEAFDVDEN